MANTNMGAQIDSYLRSKGSPLAGYGQVFVKAGRKHGVDPRLLVAISGAESSFAKYKPAQEIYNAWGWGPHKQFQSWPDGIYNVARGLGENYIRQGLTTIPDISGKYAPIGAANDPTNLNRNWVSTVSQFYQELGGKSPAVRPSTHEARFPMSSRPKPPLEGLQALAQGRYNPVDMLGLSAQEPSETSLAYQGETLTPVPKGVIDTGSIGKGTHVTSGLGWGTKTAVDLMHPPGTPVGAPASGTIIRHGSAQGGQALYFQGDNGKLYWLGHIEQMLPVGTRVDRGTPIAVVSADHKAPHVHVDWRPL